MLSNLFTRDNLSSQEAFKKHELTDSKLMEEMKSLNNKRKKTKTLLAKEKESLEQFEKVPEKNKDKIEECQDLQKKFEVNICEKIFWDICPKFF